MKKFGEPTDSTPIDEGRGHARIYVFDQDPSAPTYIAVWEVNGTIVAVQMPGFAGVHLGDDRKALEAKLGPAAELWSYQPFPFSIAIRDGRVYSIKVWRTGPTQPCACGTPGCCSKGAPAKP